MSNGTGRMLNGVRLYSGGVVDIPAEQIEAIYSARMAQIRQMPTHCAANFDHVLRYDDESGVRCCDCGWTPEPRR